MTTLEIFHTCMRQEIDAVAHRTTPWPHLFPHLRRLQEQHLGQHCYLAEEFLPAEELKALKALLKLDERQWQTYKWTFLHTAAAY